jgi:hypothetical protein
MTKSINGLLKKLKCLKKCLDLRRERYLIEPERELKQGNKRIFSFGKDDNEILETKKSGLL